MTKRNVVWLIIGIAGFSIPLYGDLTTRTSPMTLMQPAIVTILTEPQETLINANRIIERVNSNRAQAGAVAVKANPILTKIAQEKAERYAAADHYAHEDIDGQMVWHYYIENGYTYYRAGENIARMPISADSDYLMQQWEDSPAHYKNLMYSGYRDIGVGIAVGVHNGRRGVWIIQLFGVKL